MCFLGSCRQNQPKCHQVHQKPVKINKKLVCASPEFLQIVCGCLAESAAAMSHTVSLIEGPAGTGKTSVAVHLLHLWANSPTVQKQVTNKPCGILAVCESNIAVDNLLSGLIKHGVPVVRCGNVDKVLPNLHVWPESYFHHCVFVETARSLRQDKK